MAAESEVKEFKMRLFVNRLESFKTWPFQEDCNCTPNKMATTGFFFCPTDAEPDVAKCYVCQKELDGWDPDDDPKKEHKSHSAKCPLLKLKNPDDPQIEQFFTLQKERECNIIIKAITQESDEAKKHLFKAADEIKKKLLPESEEAAKPKKSTRSRRTTRKDK